MTKITRANTMKNEIVNLIESSSLEKLFFNIFKARKNFLHFSRLKNDQTFSVQSNLGLRTSRNLNNSVFEQKF